MKNRNSRDWNHTCQTLINWYSKCVSHIIKISLYFYLFSRICHYRLGLCPFVSYAHLYSWYIKKMILIRFSTCSMRDPFSVIYLTSVQYFSLLGQHVTAWRWLVSESFSFVCICPQDGPGWQPEHQLRWVAGLPPAGAGDGHSCAHTLLAALHCE